MNDRVLTVTPRQRDDRTWVLAVSGELDQGSAPQLRAVLDELPFADGTVVVADLSGLAYCDSTGITVLVTAHQRARRTGTSLLLAGMDPELTRVFEIVGLDQLFAFHPTVEDALRTALD